MSKPVKVGITHGDINGVGYEVILGALSCDAIAEMFTPVVFGFYSLAEKCRRQLGLEELHLQKVKSAAAAQTGKVNIVDIAGEVPQHEPGRGTPESGKAAVEALDAAVKALKAGEIDVLVTAPISKEAVQGDSFRFPGHTEYLESCAGEGARARMILFDDTVRVALVSTHLPISKVAEAVTRKNVENTIADLDRSLRMDFGFERPKIAVLSLNPHAGDGGLLGSEETEVIGPAIKEMRDRGVLAFGPFASDGFFGMGDYRKFDGVVAMYHDQGLAPFKTLAGERGVNFTAGLPFVRTSPDHGTAFGIAWKGIADPTSMREAIYKALDIFRNRAVYVEMSANPLRRYSADKPDKGERQDRPRPQVVKDKKGSVPQPERMDAENAAEKIEDNKTTENTES
ncbi:MAG: 4-hydroxythreonine-4-phosphate dehydrogenase PdxA [Muribaculaceae bacterium]|nr:4-hydroxythreonine-4-phosphate dehydrogenase PdxA [Muribaculaceae bacterium]MDE6534351.1 4-hydroxythreonine-4-phosphate dehydrogenase PdxA [Muribaculaceae bacterium]